MRKAIAALAFLCCCWIPPALAQVSFGFESPGISIGVNLPVYPDLVRIPGYPVYYAPNLDANYFFYDGLYWVFMDGNWYASSWYNGPWQLVSDDMVPLYLLRVPVRYYRAPPVFFRTWSRNAPPHWGEHWGAGWEQRHSGWDHWNRASAPAPAPLPTYQRQYSGNRYPRSVEQQRTLEGRNYHYQPHDRFAQQHIPSGAPAQNAQALQPNARTNTANDRVRNERAPRGATPPTVAHEAVPPPAARATPPSLAEHRAPMTEQRAQAPRPEQRAMTSRPEEHAAPRPEQRAAAPRPEQHVAAPRPEQHARQPARRRKLRHGHRSRVHRKRRLVRRSRVRRKRRRAQRNRVRRKRRRVHRNRVRPTRRMAAARTTKTPAPANAATRTTDRLAPWGEKGHLRGGLFVRAWAPIRPQDPE
jgi:hypothetical protein